MKSLVLISVLCFISLFANQPNKVLTSNEEREVIELCTKHLKDKGLNPDSYKVKILSKIIAVKDLKKENPFRGKKNKYYEIVSRELRNRKFVRVFFYSGGDVIDGTIVYYVDPNNKEILRVDNF